MASGGIKWPWSPGALLSALLGAWAIERRVDETASLTGRARFECLGEAEAAYHEQGTLQLTGGFETAAERSYIFRQRADGFAVFFHERPPRLFHAVTLAAATDGGLEGAAEHVCAEDLYLTEYKFSSADLFQVRHRVRGPRKAYTMTTIYRRIAEAGR